MPDWSEIVRQRLGVLGLAPEREAEIVAELAAHLENLAAELRQQGMSEEESTRQALATVPDWARLRRRIRSEEKGEGLMSNFRKHVWLPGIHSLGLFILSAVIVWLTSFALYRSGVLQPPDWRAREAIITIWYLLFLGLGAMAAYKSMRAGGNGRERVVAALFFPIGLTAAMIVGLPLRAMTVAQVFDPYIGQFALFAILFPTAALVLGTIPFLRRNPS